VLLWSIVPTFISWFRFFTGDDALPDGPKNAPFISLFSKQFPWGGTTWSLAESRTPSPLPQEYRLRPEFTFSIPAPPYLMYNMNHKTPLSASFPDTIVAQIPEIVFLHSVQASSPLVPESLPPHRELFQDKAWRFPLFLRSPRNSPDCWAHFSIIPRQFISPRVPLKYPVPLRVTFGVWPYPKFSPGPTRPLFSSLCGLMNFRYFLSPIVEFLLTPRHPAYLRP